MLLLRKEQDTLLRGKIYGTIETLRSIGKDEDDIVGYLINKYPNIPKETLVSYTQESEGDWA